MKIFRCSLGYNSPAFCSRKSSVQKADDIQRQTRKTFPMISPTFVDAFYRIDKYSAEDKIRAERISDNIHRKIIDARERELYPDYYGIEQTALQKDTPYSLILTMVRDLKLGNCKENAKAAVAILCANGYMNSQRAELFLQVNIVNKKTKKVEYTECTPLDHSFAITDMNTEKDLDIVVDPWLGFADTKDRAIAKFKAMYDEKDFYEPKSYCKYRFFSSKYEKGENVKMDDYEIKTKMVILPAESLSKKELENLYYFAKLINKNIAPCD